MLYFIVCACVAVRLYAFPSTVYFQKQRNGSVFYQHSQCIQDSDGQNEQQCRQIRELKGSQQSARFLSLAIDTTGKRMYYSDAKSIQSTAMDGSDAKTVIGAIAVIEFIGTQFGRLETDVLEIRIGDTKCVSILKWNSSYVRCLASLPFPPYPLRLFQDNCSIQTIYGKKNGITRDANVLSSSDTFLPIIHDIRLDISAILPHAIAISGDQWIYWSNSANGCVYRSNLRSNALETIDTNAWNVKGIVLFPLYNAILYSQELIGSILCKNLSNPFSSKAITLVSDLNCPRGLAMDGRDLLYYAERTGRVFQAVLHHTDGRLHGILSVKEILTLTSTSRLDGIAIAQDNLYYSDANANTLSRISLLTYKREILVQYHISWPRAIAIHERKEQLSIYFTEYVGRITKLVERSTRTLLDKVSTVAMQFLDAEIQEQRDGRIAFYALE